MSEGCQVVLVDAAGRILLQLRDDIPTIPFPGMWAIPGGMLEPGETPLACIVREVEEELGVRIAPAEVAHLMTRTRSYGIEHTFTARLDVAAEDIRLTEGQRVAWFPVADAVGMELAYEDADVLREVAGRVARG
ncbi:NUDIX hydrolase [Clavibacter michiganensis]|uniref:NUDIX hydrolase n=1 Tax=Clavibacter michiganensis TaxID=28447 RepID=UPI000B68CA3A|nr:NUDIX hydrolase [Clavibacter michiganensis]MDO4019777.1 NUDIX hydrolase [Clavibacter michiganensis]MDO4030302.1 NUDIX hydrolase [Clavibacter michiganensis]MDO4039682.1 NUDIX hydrolase [Clavibacter michiganensis]MDO4051856.1 NUDIX hydrolase [Clavibacter michiganensis]MDO4064199.1 NUDIX hydrolase [Clavibacter michiganensis]